MSAWDSQFNAFVTLLVTISPHSLAPLFLALTAGMNRTERNPAATRSRLIGFLVLPWWARGWLERYRHRPGMPAAGAGWSRRITSGASARASRGIERSTLIARKRSAR